MAQKRSLMEKAVRAAVQRHVRGWPPYPYLVISETNSGHKLVWRSPTEPLNPTQIVYIETRGLPSKDSFQIVSCVGHRRWTHRDEQLMHNERVVASPLDWSVNPKDVTTMTPSACRDMLRHFGLAWSQDRPISAFLETLNAQAISAHQKLRAALDVLQNIHSLDMDASMGALARLVLAHAMDKGDNAWACSFEHSQGRWRSMSIVVWPSNGIWNMSVVPKHKAVLVSDYHWRDESGKWVFRDCIRPQALAATLASRGSYERYMRSCHLDEEFSRVHQEAVQRLLSKPIDTIEPDTVWLDSIVALHANCTQLTKDEAGYYSSIRSFETQAGDCLRLHATTPQGSALAACMDVLQELQGEPKNMEEWFPRLHAWGNAIKGVEPDSLSVDNHLFEGENP